MEGMMAKKPAQWASQKKTLRFFLFLCVGLLVSMTVVLFSSSSQAEENSEYLVKAKERKYAGGADESDLKVQKILSVNSDKKEKTEESSEGF
jgi:exopolysaccharide biosynthesis protein